MGHTVLHPHALIPFDNPQVRRDNNTLGSWFSQAHVHEGREKIANIIRTEGGPHHNYPPLTASSNDSE